MNATTGVEIRSKKQQKAAAVPAISGLLVSCLGAPLTWRVISYNCALTEPLSATWQAANALGAFVCLGLFALAGLQVIASFRNGALEDLPELDNSFSEMFRQPYWWTMWANGLTVVAWMVCATLIVMGHQAAVP